MRVTSIFRRRQPKTAKSSPGRRSSRALAVDINPRAAARHIPCTKRRPPKRCGGNLFPWKKMRWNATINCFMEHLFFGWFLSSFLALGWTWRDNISMWGHQSNGMEWIQAESTDQRTCHKNKSTCNGFIWGSQKINPTLRFFLIHSSR